jgi:tRNA-binding EMAP/Myf-like protein
MNQIKVGTITDIKDLATSANSKKMRACVIDVGGDESLSVVTTAANVRIGSRIVVACIGSIVPVGKELDDGAIAVVKSNVGGVTSEGILCDSTMLGWKGGAEGVAVQVPESCALGSEPPSSKPRLDGSSSEPTASSDEPAVEVKGLFEKKLSKEEKKAAAGAARDAKRAAKAAKADEASLDNLKIE